VLASTDASPVSIKQSAVEYRVTTRTDPEIAGDVLDPDVKGT
jgi:hypothetical protein